MSDLTQSSSKKCKVSTIVIETIVGAAVGGVSGGLALGPLGAGVVGTLGAVGGFSNAAIPCVDAKLAAKKADIGPNTSRQ